MRRFRGFTLIEVMIVLSILAVISVLAYNHFGTVSAEAKDKQLAAKLYSDFQMYDDAIEMLSLKLGRDPIATGNGGFGSLDLDDHGILKGASRYAPSEAMEGSEQYYAYHNTIQNIGGSPATDQYLYLTGVKKSVCRKFNAQYSPLGDTIWDRVAESYNYPPVGSGPYCLYSSIMERYYIYWPLEYR